MISKPKTITQEISSKIHTMIGLLHPAVFDKATLNNMLTEIEDIVDSVITTSKVGGSRMTDTKFKAVETCIEDYESLVKEIKMDIYAQELGEVRSKLIELDAKIRKLIRTINLLSSEEKASFRILDESGYTFSIGELSEIDEKICKLSPTAQRVLKAVIDSPLKAVSISDLARRVGAVDSEGKVSSDFHEVIGEITSTIPELVALEPTSSGKAFVLRWKGW